MPAFIFYENFSDRNRSIFAGFMALIQMKVYHEINSILYTEYDPAISRLRQLFKQNGTISLKESKGLILP